MYAPDVGGQSRPRIAPSELNLGRSLRRRRRPTLLLRHTDGRWIEVARFGSVGEAEAAVDREVGAGHGSLGEYRVAPITRSRSARIGAAVAIVVACTALVALATFALTRSRLLVRDRLEDIQARGASRRPDRGGDPEERRHQQHEDELARRDREAVDPEVRQGALHRPPE